MTYSKNNTLLSLEMERIKEEIKKRALENESALEKVHKSSTRFSKIMTGIHHVFTVIDPLITAGKSIPIVGTVIQFLSVIPKAISILTDPQKTVKEKVISGVLIGAISILIIAAIASGTLAALAIGVTLASAATIMAGLELAGKIAEKYKSSKDCAHKKELNSLLEKRKMPESDKFNDDLELRAVELAYKIKDRQLKEAEREQLTEELEFIHSIFLEKKIILGAKEKSPAFKLQELYSKKEEQHSQLKEQIMTLKTLSDPEERKIELNKILEMRKEIGKIEEQIQDMTKPLKQLEIENKIASENLALSVSTFALAGAGTIVSILALSLFTAGIVLPVAVAPVLLAIGITMAIVGFCKFVAEKIAEDEVNSKKQKQSELNNELCLDKALDSCQRDLALQRTGTTSYAKHMKELLMPSISSETLVTLKNVPGSSPDALVSQEFAHDAEDAEAANLQNESFPFPVPLSQELSKDGEDGEDGDKVSMSNF